MRPVKSLSLSQTSQQVGRITRRIRVCNCPYCYGVTRLDPVRDGMALSICVHCFAPFENDKVVSRLQEPEL